MLEVYNINHFPRKALYFKASLEPDELIARVKAIRNIELALGSRVKKTSKSEKPNMAIARKSIVAKGTIKKDELLTEDNLAIKRPGTGISPMRWDDIIGSLFEAL